MTISVPEHDRDSICGPAKLSATPESFGTVRSRRYSANGLYAEGDELVVDGGTLSGLEIGRNFVVRRTYRIEWDPRAETGEHTAGLVQIVAADEHASVAVVMYACDEIMPGDRLASFNPEPLRPPAPVGTPDYRDAARILFPDIGQLLGAPRRLMVIDRGTSSGVRVGQRVTLFRRRQSGGNDSVVMTLSLSPSWIDPATIRGTCHGRDLGGDLPHRNAEGSGPIALKESLFGPLLTGEAGLLATAGRPGLSLNNTHVLCATVVELIDACLYPNAREPAVTATERGPRDPGKCPPDASLGAFCHLVTSGSSEGGPARRTDYPGPASWSAVITEFVGAGSIARCNC